MSEPATLRLAAPAKVNLGLRILGRREDGYHLLDSLFAPLACPGPLCDEVEVSLAPGPGVSLALEGAPSAGASDPARALPEPAAVPGGADNLAHRAAAAFLGGGSSDAGAVLRALARLVPGRIADPRLRALALGLGADVPFFLDPRPARVSGIGECIGPAEPLPPLPILVVHPGESLSTAEVYRAADARGGALTEDAPLPSIRALRGAGGGLDRELLARLLRNDLEPAATALCPEIARVRSALGDVGAAGVGMTGSGPVVYGIFEEESERDEARQRLRLPPAMRVFAAALSGAAPGG